MLHVSIGVQYYTNIFTHYFIFTAKLESDAHSRDLALTGDKVKEVRKITQDVFTNLHSDLEDFLKPLLKSVAANMFACHLITRNKQIYSDMTTEIINDVHELRKHCELFLQSLAQQGGSLKNATNSIAEAWAINIREKLHTTIKFECKL